MQPVFTHVPPNSLRSTNATFMPAPVRRPASEGPGLAGPDDDRVEVAHGSATMIEQRAADRHRVLDERRRAIAAECRRQPRATRAPSKRADHGTDDARNQPGEERPACRADGRTREASRQDAGAELRRAPYDWVCSGADR